MRRRREERSREPRRRGGFFGFIGSMIKLVLIVGVLAGIAFFVFTNAFQSPGPLERLVVVDIKPGIGLTKIADNLESAGVISDSTMFMTGVFLNNMNRQLKAGEFEIPAHASMQDVMEILVEGKALLYKITFPEGLTSYEIVQRLNQDERLLGEITSIPPEGSLLPETYTYPRETTKQEILNQMAAARDAFLARAWEQRASSLAISSPDEAMILASIVEKETGVAEERRLVASVFSNRLRRGMRLQSDPTIIYGVTNGQGKLDRPIYQSDIDRRTAYNTYQIDGLPPTPIANPGKASIESVLNPALSDYLFFVADGTGGHVFATSLAEHTRNVARWRQIERRLRAEEAARAAQQANQPNSETGVVETETEDLPILNQ